MPGCLSPAKRDRLESDCPKGRVGSNLAKSSMLRIESPAPGALSKTTRHRRVACYGSSINSAVVFDTLKNLQQQIFGAPEILKANFLVLNIPREVVFEHAQKCFAFLANQKFAMRISKFNKFHPHIVGSAKPLILYKWNIVVLNNNLFIQTNFSFWLWA